MLTEEMARQYEAAAMELFRYDAVTDTASLEWKALHIVRSGSKGERIGFHAAHNRAARLLRECIEKGEVLR